MSIAPPILAIGAAIAQRALGRRPTRMSAVLAAPVLVASVALWQGAVLTMRRHRTTIDPHRLQDASALVTTGPFALSRNPIYAGLAGLLIGHAILSRSPLGLLPAAGFVAALDRRQIPAEEAALRSQFPEFAAYTRRVPRWIGPVRRSRR